jgi:hypothetical protein
VTAREDLESRKTWLYETQLRRLNYTAFRGIAPDSADPLLDLISERAGADAPPTIGTRLTATGPVYLDNQRPVWTADEHTRRDTFAKTMTGWMGNWFDNVQPTRLAGALRDLQLLYANSTYASDTDPDLPFAVSRFRRSQPGFGNGVDPKGDDEGIGVATSRAELAAAKPWLIPELYNAKNKDTSDVGNWIENLEKFVADYETELQLVVGDTAGTALPFDQANPATYQAFIYTLQTAESARPASDAVQVRVLELYMKDPNDKTATWRYRPSIQTSGYAMGPVTAFPLSDKVKYWTGVMFNAMKEASVLKANSDMGNCQLVRLLYRYGPIRDTLGTDAQLAWRVRLAPDARFVAYFDKKAKDPRISTDASLQQRLAAARAKLEIILTGAAAHPRCTSPMFSPLAAEIAKQCLLSYKFWFDEAMRAKGNDRLNKVKGDVLPGDSDAKADTEMEFWSENHYVMFASMEHLFGQLWEPESFQPGRLFAEAGDTKGRLTGTQRKERGRARVLKWLNNRLQFGWTEFNSHGYYAEHLWSILNLADFALDEQVRVKATIAVDLLMFDTLRFAHKGSNGAPGGRSQFKFKNSGWDNALGDVVEVITGDRGVFNEGNSEIGVAFTTSTYRLPDALLELATSPPRAGFVDRSRVSITFDEAPKYGITWSQASDAKDSVFNGYAPKRATYYPYLDEANKEIERTHNNYGATDDDTVFFWTMSAFYNKQNVRNTFLTVGKFSLDESPIFKGFLNSFIGTLIPLIERFGHGLIDLATLGPLRHPFDEPEVAFESIDDLFSSQATLQALAADDVSPFIEGSTRTRANVLTYRNGDVMLSSIQNFRVGQLNFQSTVSSATLATSISVFGTAGFAGFDISDLATGLIGSIGGAITGAVGGFVVGAVGGFVVGGPAGAAAGAAGGAAVGGATGAVAGGVAGVVLNENDVHGKNLLGDDDDGPGWWSGYWALPMIVQSGSAAIAVYDFNDMQRFLADVGSHFWFPKSGFSQVEDRRTSAYDDANFPLLDITDIGPKGFWTFGKVVHPPKPGSAQPPTEGYVGVFSNERPEWLDHTSDPYDKREAAASDDAIADKLGSISDTLDDLEDKDDVGDSGRKTIDDLVTESVDAHYAPGITRDDWLAVVKADVAASTMPVVTAHRDDVNGLAEMYVDLKTLQRIWKRPFPDYFAGRDCYVSGKNVWILQVGSKDEFGSFENFMDRVSSARVHLDDTGDMECTYDIPKPDGSSDRLSLAYGDGGRFGLNGGGFDTDLYPRFETPFVRGGRVEWGQREYCIEWNGATLLHDFSDSNNPVRVESPPVLPNEASTIKALVIYLRTGGEDMDTNTVGRATVEIGCRTATSDQVIAAGPVGSDTTHDAEWIFFDAPAVRDCDMSVTIDHPGNDDDSTPAWTMSFTLKALMGDRTLRDCTLTTGSASFRDGWRSTGALPFVIPMSAWSSWREMTLADPLASRWWLGRSPARGPAWQSYHDVVILDRQEDLQYARLHCGTAGDGWEPIGRQGSSPDWSGTVSMQVLSRSGGGVDVVAVTRGRLVARSRDAAVGWSREWVDLQPTYLVASILGPLEVPEAVPLDDRSTLAVEAGDVFVTGADDNVYRAAGWRPDVPITWEQIPCVGFTPAPGVAVQVVDGRLFVLSTEHEVWSVPAHAAVTSVFLEWSKVTPDNEFVVRFAAGSGGGGAFCLALCDVGGVVRVSTNALGPDPAWGLVAGGSVSARDDLAWVSPTDGDPWLVAVGAVGAVGVVVAARPSSNSLPAWTNAGAETREVAFGGGIAAATRAAGQFEVFVRDAAGNLSSAWWA